VRPHRLLLSRLVKVVVTLALFGAIWLVIRGRVGRPTIAGEFRTWAVFRDASGLPVRSRVLIAGVQVGEISHLTVEGSLARVDMRLTDDVVLWDDAFAMKSGSLAFGDSHVEIFPGGPEDPRTGDGGHHRLRSGDPIPRVVEGDSTDRFLRAVDRTLPRFDSSLNSFDEFVGRSRRFFDAVATQRIASVDQRLSTDLGRPIDDAARAVDRFDAWTRRAQRAVADVAPTVPGRLDRLASQLKTASTRMKDWQGDVHDALGDARTRLDDVDPYLARANAWLVRQGADVRIARAEREAAEPEAGAGAEEKSAFGKLVDDPSLADRIADATQQAANYTATLDQVRAVIGLRNEFTIRSRSLNAYLTMELSGRNDRFFMLELERGSIGKLADIEITETPGGNYVRRTTITGGFRLSAMWGKRIGWFDYRFGLKESTFGVGADAVLLGGRLRFAGDLYGENFSRVPRLKLEAALEVLRSVYVFGGIDDALAPPGTLRIAPWPATATTPTDYSSLSFGRDYFAGFVFKLNEEDATRMLRIYGSFIGAFL
jgi:phospholipid/cholesterol/gamma-HCH transport system substrate-binding protein